MPVDHFEKISECLARAAELRKRAGSDADPVSNSALRDLALQWQEIAESYKLVEDTDRYLKTLRARQSAPRERGAQRAARILPPNGCIEPPSRMNGESFANLLGVLVQAAIEHADGKARAAFYITDPTGRELHHVIGMPVAYARCVNGFAVGTQSLACGLAVATRQPVVTPDVTEEPRWRPWVWLAEEFDYRACWSFPVVVSSGKVLGSFAMYYSAPRQATPRDLELADVLSRTAAKVISQTLNSE